MSFVNLPKGTIVPHHIAIIPDGNRRWARARGAGTLKGHKAGFDRAIELSKAARNLGVHTVTLWGFSTENWDRTKTEIDYLMKLYVRLIDKYLEEAKKDNVRLVHLGRKDRLPNFLVNRIKKAEEETKNYTKHIGNIALDYGGQDEILRAVRQIVKDGISEEKIDNILLSKYLDTSNQPYPNPDLIIRTSGEQRSSGILLWQSHYAETYWENCHFPDFSPEKLRTAILDYSRRRRRFGGNDKLTHFKFKPEVVAKFELAWWRLGNIPEGERFRDYAFRHIKEQFGLSRSLAKEAAIYMGDAILLGEQNKWLKAKASLKKFYKLLREEVKLAFEPTIVASLELKLMEEMGKSTNSSESLVAESVARELYAEVYRISLFQAAKLAHLRVLASLERNLARKGFGDHHWERAEDYLRKFYLELKDKIA